MSRARYSSVAKTSTSAKPSASQNQDSSHSHCLGASLTRLNRSENGTFVIKRVPRLFWDHNMRLAADCAGSRSLRLHVDSNQEEGILIYPYFRSTFLALVQDYPDFPVGERQKILRRVGEAIQELHSKDWVHLGTYAAMTNLTDLRAFSLTIFFRYLDIKPDNILVNWTYDEDGDKTVTDVVLGDFDISFKSANGKPRCTPFAIGNVMWRSPEGQTGRGMTKASDMYSFGLVVC
jgi:serine/threonine protein kinase